MGLFKKKVVKQIEGAVWGCLFNQYGINVDILSKEIRCVEKPGTLEGGHPVTFLRVFKPKEAAEKGVVVEGWESFDQHPDVILFEGYVTPRNEAHLEKKQ